MVDMTMISGAMSAMKVVSATAKAMVAIHDASVLRTKVVELNTQIQSAQSSALAALSDQFALLERVGKLEKEIADFKDWEREKQRYEMKRVQPGAVVYALKEQEQGTEPAHWICAACYQRGEKSILQAGREHFQHDTEWPCPTCKAGIFVNPSISPEEP
jgi:rubrerythrin